MAFNLETCRSKDELESFARQMFNVELDKRKKLDELKNEIRQLMNGGEPLEQPDELEEPDVTEVPTALEQPVPTPQPRHRKPLQFVLNKNNHSVFIYNPRLKKRIGVDLEFCDQQGNRL
ncbi:hypothetical protein [Endozoicomonas sp. SCSIO W0465]|uniref:hypothetical protein n=1 Tax=Endozoicomonas sp. SCSIO W0465 TaxID=2918516 RepID=UPI002074C0D2|nr:hypothetical protein [Endozoicomonas sp. SCSIO W0465]USE36789.1 hypothetical protein MJO57_00660 [Endozoicomonas sp. SCSIO W0465]